MFGTRPFFSSPKYEVTLLELLENLQEAIANGHSEEAARSAVKLAGLKVNCNITLNEYVFLLIIRSEAE